MSIASRASFLVIALKHAIVEDVAVLEHLDDRTALVIVGSTEHLLHVTAIHVVRAGDKGRLSTKRHRDGVEGLIDRDPSAWTW